MYTMSDNKAKTKKYVTTPTAEGIFYGSNDLVNIPAGVIESKTSELNVQRSFARTKELSEDDIGYTPNNGSPFVVNDEQDLTTFDIHNAMHNRTTTTKGDEEIFEGIKVVNRSAIDVIPRATKTTPGIVIVGDNLEVDENGRIKVVGLSGYVHPSTHPATMIVEDTTHRFVTDAEKTKWNSKAEGNHTHNWSSISDKPSTFPPSNHNHDSVYAKISHTHSEYQPKGSYANTDHNHDSVYSKLNHRHDDLYQPKGNYAPSSHTHDDRYYTEGEINNKLNSYSLTSHNHNGVYAPVSHTHSEYQPKGNYQPAGNYASGNHTHNVIKDIGNSNDTTFAYSKSGMGYGEFTWLAGWNGYELRAVDKSLFLPTSGGTINGSLTVTGQILSNVDVIVTSDARYKTNIKRIEHPLDAIKSINGYKYDMLGVENKNQVGLIAQEVSKVLPEAVYENKNGYMGIRYTNIIPLLVEAVKELSERLEAISKER